MKNGKRSMLSHERTREILEGHLSRNAPTWELLIKNGVAEGSPLPLHFFFYTKKRDQAIALKRQLEQETDFDVRTESRGLLRKQWVVLGMTQASPVSLKTINDWCRWMTETGAMFDCEFDGWEAQIG